MTSNFDKTTWEHMTEENHNKRPHTVHTDYPARKEEWVQEGVDCNFFKAVSNVPALVESLMTKNFNDIENIIPAYLPLSYAFSIFKQDVVSQVSNSRFKTIKDIAQKIRKHMGENGLNYGFLLQQSPIFAENLYIDKEDFPAFPNELDNYSYVKSTPISPSDYYMAARLSFRDEQVTDFAVMMEVVRSQSDSYILPEKTQASFELLAIAYDNYLKVNYQYPFKEIESAYGEVSE